MTIALTAYATHHSEGLNITVISSLWWITLHEGEKLTVLSMPTSLTQAQHFREIRDEHIVKIPNPLL